MEVRQNQSQYYLALVLGVYLACSIPIFNEVYNTSKVIVDETFHIPQAQAYCKGRYDIWNPKITTLPGLYIAVKIIQLFVECDTYYLRMFNLLLSTFNLALFYKFFNFTYGRGTSQFNIALQALSIATLPPLYFFSLVFYTDTLSLTFILLFAIHAIKHSKFGIIFYGICSIATRQTNVVWIIMIFCQKTLELAVRSSRVYGNRYIQYPKKRATGKMYELDPKAMKKFYDVDDFQIASNFHWDTEFRYFFNASLKHELKLVFYMIIPVILFATFVLCNGSIVVGDKAAHAMTVNFPQITYFLLFYGFFALPVVIANTKSTFTSMWYNKETVAMLVVLYFLAIHFNTEVHPYLLADNRHYTFYIWNRWFGKYPFAGYALIPVYVFLSCSFTDNLLYQNCLSFNLAFFTWLVPAVCFQRLLELRYFIIPYIITRLRFPKLSTTLVVAEFLWYTAINVAYFTVFFTKEVEWDDLDQTQRIIW